MIAAQSGIKRSWVLQYSIIQVTDVTENNSIKNAIRIANITANPAPLGLLAFSMTTVLLNLHNAGHSAMYTGPRAADE